MRANLPEALNETAYALACDVAAADGTLNDRELRLLEEMRYELDIDRLHAAAIERGAGAEELDIQRVAAGPGPPAAKADFFGTPPQQLSEQQPLIRAGRIEVADVVVGAEVQLQEIRQCLHGLSPWHANVLRVHLTNAGAVSWFEFVGEILAASGFERSLVSPISTDQLDPPRPAPRPVNSVLANERWVASGRSPLRDFREPLAELCARFEAS
jgi:hypothetical protein